MNTSTKFDVTCRICGTPFRSIRQNACYCSKQCRLIGNNETRRKVKNCVVCGKTFVKAHSTVKTCSASCSAKLRMTHRFDSSTARMDKYHSKSLDRKAKEWGHRYGIEQGKTTLAMVGGVDVKGIMKELKR